MLNSLKEKETEIKTRLKLYEIDVRIYLNL